MLTHLSIQNIAVIEKASIDFEDGFSVLTGETGAGKSIIIDALNMVLGERASRDLVRTGTDRAMVSAVFADLPETVLQMIDELGFQIDEDDQLLIQREIRNEGKSLCKINGMPATASMLKSVCRNLVGILGQHESYELLSETAHMDYIDDYAENKALLDRYQKSFLQLKDIQKQLIELNLDEEQKARKMDLLTYQIEEIDAAGISPGEQAALISERDIIQNRAKISAAAEQVKALLSGTEEHNGILSDLALSIKAMAEAAEYVAALKEASGKMQEAYYLIEDAESIIRDADISFDGNTMNEIEDRLDVIYKLSLKYGETEEEILQFCEACREQLQEIAFAAEKAVQLEKAYEEEKAHAIALAKELSQRRKQASAQFTERVKEELTFLNMPGINFQVDIARVPLNQHGCDKIQFLVSVNKGEPVKPMAKIASGGELSRIMLAIKTVISGKGEVKTFIFDEIDTGISGDAGNKVGDKLKEVAGSSQVICITHLPQIAARADNHYLIQKNSDTKRTYTEIKRLNKQERIDEVARIIGGTKATELNRSLAAEMIEMGK